MAMLNNQHAKARNNDDLCQPPAPQDNPGHLC